MNEENEEILQDIISEIQTSSTNCEWFLDSERLIELLGISKETYYRELYSIKINHVHDYSIRKGFSESQAEILCLLLKKILKIETIENSFIKSGIYFSEESLKDLRETFLNLVYSSLTKHKLDKDLLLLLSSATKNFDDAFDSYFIDKFDLETLFERSINIYTNVNSIETLYGAENFLKKYLTDSIQYKRIKLEKITTEFRLRYHYDLFGATKPKRKRKLNSELDELLNFFGLERDATEKDLKIKFKSLLKKYHPDVNKDGLETTKIIIHNYNKLLKYFA